MSKLIYFASPIDRATRDDKFDSYKALVSQTLVECGYVMFHPHDAFCMAANAERITSPYIRDINNFALSRASGLVAVINENQQSWGVPAEIERALVTHKPVALIRVGRSQPTWSQRYSDDLMLTFLPPSVDAATDSVKNTVKTILRRFDRVWGNIHEEEEQW